MAQVLDIILQAKGLDKRVQGSVVLIAPKQELVQSEQQLLEAKRKEQDLASLRSEIIPVSYAKATDLADLLQARIVAAVCFQNVAPCMLMIEPTH